MRRIRKLFGVFALVLSVFIAALAFSEPGLSAFGVGFLLFTGLGGMFLVCS